MAMPLLFTGTMKDMASMVTMKYRSGQWKIDPISQESKQAGARFSMVLPCGGIPF